MKYFSLEFSQKQTFFEMSKIRIYVNELCKLDELMKLNSPAKFQSFIAMSFLMNSVNDVLLI